MDRTAAFIKDEVMAGVALAKNIKDFFYSDTLWSAKPAWDIGVLMKDIKLKAKDYYPDETMNTILAKLATYDKEALLDLINITKDGYEKRICFAGEEMEG